MDIWSKAVLVRVNENPVFSVEAMALRFGHAIEEVGAPLSWLKANGYVAGSGEWFDGIERLAVTPAGLEALGA